MGSEGEDVRRVEEEEDLLLLLSSPSTTPGEGASSYTGTPWVRLGERAQVRGTIQWDRPLLLPLGVADTFLEMANREEALAWHVNKLSAGGELRVANKTSVGEAPEEEVDIREEPTAEEVKLVESRALGARRIAHVPTGRRDRLSSELVGHTPTSAAITNSITKTDTDTDTADTNTILKVERGNPTGRSIDRHQTNLSGHAALKGDLQEEALLPRPVVLDSLVRERSTFSRDSPTADGPPCPSKSAPFPPPTRPSLFKQSRRLN